ncbi:hypothetical protein [Schlesneria paludicola]|uniref:hypothetical protein n=1 Tax=Schlesneria paludicola TaxID=360056 RepID=UPI00029B4192|nr:hypothetical protein [Schlesneria paludicola]
MQGLFQGWRRRCGIVTLVMAFAALGGWVRSLTVFDHLGYRITNGFYSLDSNLGTFMTRRSTTSATINANMLNLAAPMIFNTVSIQPATGPVSAIPNAATPTMTGVILAVDASTIQMPPVNAAVFVAGSPTIAATTEPSTVSPTDDNIESEEPAEDSEPVSSAEPAGFTDCVVSNFQVQPVPSGNTTLVLTTLPSTSPFRWITSRTVDQSHFLSGMPIVSEWKFCGVHYMLSRMDMTDGDGVIKPLSETISLTVPYWIVAIPLILLSAYLLVSAPKLRASPAIPPINSATSS